MRVFPLSNWTELDVWRYIQREQIEVVPLYFAEPRPVVDRGGQLIMVDDDRYPLEAGEQPELRRRAVPHAGLLPADRRGRVAGRDLDALIAEMLVDRRSERAGRLIDGEGGGSMESKKTEGYF